MSDYRELLIGCGYDRTKRIPIPGSERAHEWKGLVTLDLNTDCKPDIVANLNSYRWTVLSYENRVHADLIRYDGYATLALRDNLFNEVHAYEVLEHLGQQGDAPAFFATFSEIWRVLKPDGFLAATVPSRYSAWLWGDPSHRRAILPESLVFLDQEQYVKQCDSEPRTPMSDFRSFYKADFRCVQKADNRETFAFILQAIKPSRYVK